jgi:hypothetical protein
VTWCVYALGSPVRGRLGITGLAGERLTVIREGSLAAFAGDVRRLPWPVEEQLRRYDRIQQRLAARVSALLPARYGTEVRDLEELQVILRSRQASLRRQLATVRGRVQMTVRLLDSSSTPVARTFLGSRGEPHKARPTGREYLLSRAEAHRLPEFDRLRTGVRRWVRAERVEKRDSTATVYHLVPRWSAAAYRRALERGAAAAGVRVLISGPWPPYAFADPLD